jgi:MoxR-like ATPase
LGDEANERSGVQSLRGRSIRTAGARSGHRYSAQHLIAAVERASPPAQQPTLTIEDVAALGERLRANLRAGVHLRASVLEAVLAALLAGGHLLVEDHPGVGKTQLARTLASSLASSFSRVQATVDLLPSDIVGASIWRPESASFEFRAGPVFAHVVLVDELNRATPKTQSGLLEAMQERQVTVDGESQPLPSPFMVIATQNPTAGFDGTYPLPPAQLDRFLARVSLGYPTAEQEVALLTSGLSGVSPVSTPQELQAAQHAVAGIHTSEPLVRYVVALLAATREHPLIEVGASPRAGLLLLGAARAGAAIDERDFVVPDDVQAIAHAVLEHRLKPAAAAGIGAAEEVVEDVLAKVPAR